MARIPLFPSANMDAAQRAVLDKVLTGPRGRIQGPLRAALHNPELADKWQALGALLRYGTSLPPRLSEIAILVTGRACHSPFEWYAHRIQGQKAGLEPALPPTSRWTSPRTSRSGGPSWPSASSAA